MKCNIKGCGKIEGGFEDGICRPCYAFITADQGKEHMTRTEQEPVAWMDEDGDVLSASIVDGKGLRNIPLYTTPPQRTWVGLTDEEVKDIVWNLPYEPSQEHIRAIEAKLKDKNR